MLDDLIRERRKKLSNIRDAGRNPYPSKSRRNFSIEDTLKEFSRLQKAKKQVSLAGRVASVRDQGNIIFIDIDDGTGSIQILVSKKHAHHFVFWKKNIDLGDFVEFRGGLLKTNRGEKSLQAVKVRMLTKSLRPLPKSRFGLKDEEERLRKRYIDILLDSELKDVFEKRSLLVRKTREFLWTEGFMEVETPILQPIPGGALARPFSTKHNALNQDFYLRIAPELYLKRLLVAGYNKVFEIGRVFRNEGIDREHNPEFTMLELYWTYADYKDMIKLTKKILKPIVSGKWVEISYIDAVKKYTKKSDADIRKMKGNMLDELFKKSVRPKLVKPTIVYGLPKSLSPLAKSFEDDPEITERFQLIVDGMEVANGFSELNDPIDQRERMEEQEKMYRKGDKEASRLDEDFLEALEYGMPPAAGLGVGMDRVAAIYAGKKSVKDVIIFPTLKSKLPSSHKNDSSVRKK